MKKFFSGFLVLCLSLALLTACGKDGQTGKTVAAGGLTFAKSYSEVYSADRKSTRLNSSHWNKSRMPSSA